MEKPCDTVETTTLPRNQQFDETILILFLGCVTLSVTAIENKRSTFQKTIKEIGDEIRDRKNLEYSLTLPHSHVASFRSLERRISTGPHEGGQRTGNLYQGRPGHGTVRRIRPYHLPAPSYAVQMEPMIPYSQKDPLYDANGDNFEDGLVHNDIQAQPKILNIPLSSDQRTDGNYVSEKIYNHIPQAGPPYNPVVLPYYEHPEPIIEIIIKESNESLPAPPPITQTLKRQKEPVQVFYVKYQKNPHGGENDVIYDKPIPAITPPSNSENNHHDEFTTVTPEVLTIAPLPTTTLRAIIHPESEQYHSDSGIRITFDNSNKKSQKHHDIEGHEESAPHIAVAHPQSIPVPKQVNLQISQHQKRQHVTAREQSLPIQNFQQNITPKQTNTQIAQQRIQSQPQPAVFPQNYQQLPIPNSPNQPFRPVQNQFPRLQNAALFNGPPQQHPSQIPIIQGVPARNIQPNNPPQNSQNPQNPQNPPNFPTYRPIQNFPQPRPAPTTQRGQFRQNSQRPFHQGPQPQQFQFNELEYLQQNYHTITTEQLEPPRHQLLPNNKVPPNFRNIPQTPIQSPFSISQEEYNKRYYEQLQHFKLQEQNRQRQQINTTPRPVIASKLPISNELQKPIQVNENVQQNHVSTHQQFFKLSQSSKVEDPRIPQQQQQLPLSNPLPPNPPPGSQFIPPGGEVIPSVSKYEQHLLIQPTRTAIGQQLSTTTGIQHSLPQASPLVHHFTQNILPQPEQKIVQQSQSPQLQQQHPQIQQQQIQLQHQQQPIQLQQQTQIHQQQQQQLQHQQFIDNNNSPITTDFLTVFEQNQREILELQEKLRRSEEDHKKLLALTQTSPILPSSPSPVSQIVHIQGRNPQFQKPYISHNTNKPPLISSTSRPKSIIELSTPISTTKYISSTIKSIQDKTESKKKNNGKLPAELELPDEVPDELRQQLLESGILEHAQISVLDYDKVGDIPLESLPPEQLANFYGAGGGLQISNSAPIGAVVKTNGEKVLIKPEDLEDDQEEAASEKKNVYVDTHGKKRDVEMKVVHFDPNSIKGQQVADKYVQEGATQVNPVTLNDHKYNRYLPLKVSGADFPVPDVPELAGRKVTSVVVLAPVNYDLSKSDNDSGRSERAASNKKGITFIAGDALKRLLKKPTLENYKKWLEKENTTSPDLQSVVLLVTGTNSGKGKQEIFMYDVTTQAVNKLSGQLSSAFVDVAETNAHSKDFDQLAVADSGIVESAVKVVEAKVQKPGQKEHKYSNHKQQYTEIEIKKPIDKKVNKQQASDVESNISTESIKYFETKKLSADALDNFNESNNSPNQVLINSGYSRMKMGRSLEDDS